MGDERGREHIDEAQEAEEREEELELQDEAAGWVKGGGLKYEDGQARKTSTRPREGGAVPLRQATRA